MHRWIVEINPCSSLQTAGTREALCEPAITIHVCNYVLCLPCTYMCQHLKSQHHKAVLTSQRFTMFLSSILCQSCQSPSRWLEKETWKIESAANASPMAWLWQFKLSLIPSCIFRYSQSRECTILHVWLQWETMRDQNLIGSQSKSVKNICWQNEWVLPWLNSLFPILRDTTWHNLPWRREFSNTCLNLDFPPITARHNNSFKELLRGQIPNLGDQRLTGDHWRGITQLQTLEALVVATCYPNGNWRINSWHLHAHKPSKLYIHVSWCLTLV